MKNSENYVKIFSHPSTDKLYNHLRLVKPWEFNEYKNKVLKVISMRCEDFQRFSQPLLQFKVTIPTKENLVIGDELSVDVMFLEEKLDFMSLT